LFSAKTNFREIAEVVKTLNGGSESRLAFFRHYLNIPKKDKVFFRKEEQQACKSSREERSDGKACFVATRIRAWRFFGVIYKVHNFSFDGAKEKFVRIKGRKNA